MTQHQYTLPTFTLPVTTSHADYLAWRAAWKRDYAALSATIRLMKRDWKQAQRTGTTIEHPGFRYRLAQTRNLASLALEYRSIGKVESAAAYRSTWADGTHDGLAAESGEAAMIAGTAVLS